MKQYELYSADFNTQMLEWLDELHENSINVHRATQHQILELLYDNVKRAGWKPAEDESFFYILNMLNTWRWNNQPE